ncbi:Uncharacterised protein [Pandoraea pnomenusa]|uniref:Uncharacterized protein n=1 Tax=Pandoraea pnomenusa TaxID=93220 RepID=A0A378YL65_9BURK|nr:Uncharacterised protein [Pandoraea pnomenusa]
MDAAVGAGPDGGREIGSQRSRKGNERTKGNAARERGDVSRARSDQREGIPELDERWAGMPGIST